MTNPNGPYPGRQLFLGRTANGNPALAYLVTGRSPESRDRLANPVENSIRIVPTGKTAYDPLRHYTAVKLDENSNIACVSNGIQTEAIFEAYKLVFNTGGAPNKKYMETLLEAAGAEPDSYFTPRIAGIITDLDKERPLLIVGIKGNGMAARATVVEAKPGTMTGVSVYQGNMENPVGTDPNAKLPTIEFPGKTVKSLARQIFEMSEATYKDDDIRVCAVGGIYLKQGWDFAIINRHEQ